MHKDRLLGHKACGPAFQETQMVGRHSGNCIGVDWPNGPIPCAAHTVRGQRDGPAQFGMQPRMLRLLLVLHKNKAKQNANGHAL
jgi:hypothetical protein